MFKVNNKNIRSKSLTPTGKKHPQTKTETEITRRAAYKKRE